jgi:lipoprotein-releasing system permease protein
LFELAVALKYLLPRRRQWSVSVIALLSVLVIGLVVWLLIVFLSVTRGIEQRWMKTLVALNAPLRLTPTAPYYDSYYYQIDRFSLAAGYSERTIGEKLLATADFYDPEIDPELPPSFPEAVFDERGALLDPVKRAFEAVEGLEGFSGVRSREFEVALANLRLRLVRAARRDALAGDDLRQSFSSQASYVGAFDGGSTPLAQTVMPLRPEDFDHLLQTLLLSTDSARDEMPSRELYLPPAERATQLKEFFSYARITALRTPEQGWILPPELYPESGELDVVCQKDRFLLPEQSPLEEATLLSFDRPPASPLVIPVVIPGGVVLKAQLERDSLEQATDVGHLRFKVAFTLQGISFAGSVPLRGLQVDSFWAQTHFDAEPLLAPPWPYWVAEELFLPGDPYKGHGVLLARPYREQGVLAGDGGYLSYYAATPGGLAEQRLPIFVAGFYDPGLLPTGSRYVLGAPAVTAAIRASVNQVEREKSNGIHVWIDDLGRVDEAKQQLLERLEALGIAPYWQVETFKEYEFARPLVQQFQSDRHLLSIIALIVITVACSNIISMLIVLVNDKRREIGILRSMGATSTSIALIFATCGIVMGLMGSCLGIGAGFATLANLDGLIALLSKIQGHEAFQAAFYGTSLPNAVDPHVLFFVIISTALVSLLAGLVPAAKAAALHPTAVLRSE